MHGFMAAAAVELEDVASTLFALPVIVPSAMPQRRNVGGLAAGAARG